jgi:hypothetical protein
MKEIYYKKLIIKESGFNKWKFPQKSRILSREVNPISMLRRKLIEVKNDWTFNYNRKRISSKR